MKEYYTYIMSSLNNTTIYVGVTGNLYQRVCEHKNKDNLHCFTAKYNCIKLVYFDIFNDVNQAIAREKQLKRWKREWKNNLICEKNKHWEDLFEGLIPC